MSYQALITPITNLQDIPKADRLKLATVAGSSVVVGLDSKVGDLGIFFPTDGLLSDAYCTANDLYSRVDEAGNKAGGFFTPGKPRVRAQRFRGAKSDGLWMPLTSLDFTGVNTSTLRNGTALTELNGITLCEKYETRATKAARLQGKTSNTRRETLWFKKHFETEKFRFVSDRIFNEAESIVYITEKVHGTSFRYGHVQDNDAQPTWQKWVNRLVGRQMFAPTYVYLTGSKNVILGRTSGEGYYGTNDFRHAVVANLELRKGEVIYGEIVGDVTTGSSIMPSQPIPSELKELRAAYGDTMHFRYGCAPGTQRTFIYRITQTNDDGVTLELSWNQVRQRCTELGLEAVPQLFYTTPVSVRPDDVANLCKIVEELTTGCSTIDKTHMREGVVVRVERTDGTMFAKHKSFEFGVLEGYIKLSDDYVDTEESA